MEFSLCYDYMIINLRIDKSNLDVLEAIKPSKYYDIDLQKNGTKNMAKIGHVFYEGKKLGVITYAPYQGSVIDADFCQFQIENEFFYTMHLNDLKKIILNFFIAYKLQFDGFNRIDIALDFDRTKKTIVDKWLFQLPEQLFSFEAIEFQGRVKSVDIKTNSIGGLNGWNFGQRTGDRFIRFYDKSKELQEKKNKPYIHNFWDLFGFGECHENIQRFEIQLNRRFLTEIHNFDFVFGVANMAELFEVGLRGFFSPVPKMYDIENREKIKRVKGIQEIQYIDFNELRKWSDKQSNREKFEKPKRKKCNIEENTVLQNKIFLKKMIFKYWESNEENVLPLCLANEIFNLKSGFDYWQFFCKKIPLWEKDYNDSNDYLFDFCLKTFISDLDFCKDLEFYQK